MLPYLGWAQETHQTAPSCLLARWDYISSLRFAAICVCSCRGAFADSPLERFRQPLSVTLDFEDLDRAVGRAGGEAAPVVVEDSIVLEPGHSVSQQ